MLYIRSIKMIYTVNSCSLPCGCLSPDSSFLPPPLAVANAKSRAGGSPGLQTPFHGATLRSYMPQKPERDNNKKNITKG